MASSSREQALEAGARMGGAPWFSLFWPWPCQIQVHVQQVINVDRFYGSPVFKEETGNHAPTISPCTNQDHRL